LKNHFELFGLTPSYALDTGTLDSAYRDIQATVHPDKFAHAGDAERRASMQMTTRVNEAYRTLKDPLRRAIHLLELNGIDVAFETDTAMPKEFLMEQMALREQLEEARSPAALDGLNKKLLEQKQQIQKRLAIELDSEKSFASARVLVRKLMFFDRLAEEIDEAYESLEG